MRIPTIPCVIGHRGAAMDAPENTLASIREAHRQGAKMIEFDVKLTGGPTPELIIFHDDTLDLTTNGHGLVRDVDYPTLAKLDAWRGETIPLLRDAIALLAALELDANIEIKPCPGREVETATATIKLLQQHWPANKPWPILSSFQVPCLEICRDLWPACPRGYLIDRRPDDWRDIARDLGATTLHVGHRHETATSMADYINFNLPVLVYTVNDPSLADQLTRQGVAAIFTDAPGRMISHYKPLAKPYQSRRP